MSLEGLKGPEFEDDVSRFLAANDSDADTLRMADVLVVLDFTVSAWQRQQQAETKQRKLNGVCCSPGG